MLLKISPDAFNREQAILREIVIKLYARNIFTFGQARRLANLSTLEFQQLLGQHNIQHHYNKSRFVAIMTVVCNATPLITLLSLIASMFYQSNLDKLLFPKLSRMRLLVQASQVC